jgi:hypothetical protein
MLPLRTTTAAVSPHSKLNFLKKADQSRFGAS